MYPEYKREFYKICSREFTENYFSKIQDFSKWLKSRILNHYRFPKKILPKKILLSERFLKQDSGSYNTKPRLLSCFLWLGDQFCISVVSYAEFICGVKKFANPEKYQHLVENFIHHVDIIPWDCSCTCNHLIFPWHSRHSVQRSLPNAT